MIVGCLGRGVGICVVVRVDGDGVMVMWDNEVGATFKRIITKGDREE